MKHIIKISIFFLLNCKTYKQVEDIKVCVENSRDISLSYIKDFSIYSTYEQFENFLIEKKFLEKGNKLSYINLLKEIQLNNKLMLELKKQVYDKVTNLDLLSHPTIANRPIFCIKDYLINGNLDEDKISKYKTNFNSLNIGDITSVINFINNTPDFLFQDFNFRLLILAIIYDRLNYVNGNNKLQN